MKNQNIYLIFKCDNWHSLDSRELIYIGTDSNDAIAQLNAQGFCTAQQMEQLSLHGQSQGNNVEHEWIIEEAGVNQFYNLPYCPNDDWQESAVEYLGEHCPDADSDIIAEFVIDMWQNLATNEVNLANFRDYCSIN